MNREELTRQRRKQGEELWKQKFVDLELSEKFELISRDWSSDKGRLALIRCKSCEHEFKTWNVDAYFRGKLKSFWCPECGMRSDGTIQWTKSKVHDEVFDYYLQGHTCREISEKYGISVAQFDNERKTRGITKTAEQRKESWRASQKKAQEKSRTAQKMRARQNRINRLDLLGFDYVSESDKKGRVRCRKCGFEFERTFQNLRCGNVVCSECAKVQKAAEEQARKKEQEEHKAKQEAERIAKNPLGLSYYQLCVQAKLDVVHICEVCGNKYTMRARMEKEGLKYCSDNGCCSKVCSKKRARRKMRANGFPKNHLHRAHLYGCDYESGITLKSLIKRDGLRCAICGEMCDPNDHEWTDYFGPKSPTIDHIIPMSKGGGHVWNNVQIAHAICNSAKGAQYEQG